MFVFLHFEYKSMSVMLNLLLVLDYCLTQWRSLCAERMYTTLSM